MILQALAFYVFAAITVASAAMVVVSRNPVYSVLFLILAFFNAAGLFLLIGAEFIAMILVIVYVGAVAVLASPAGTRVPWPLVVDVDADLAPGARAGGAPRAIVAAAGAVQTSPAGMRGFRMRMQVFG